MSSPNERFNLSSSIIEETSPRHSQEIGIISWQNGTIPKLRLKMPTNTKQKLAKVINKTLPSFLVSGLNEININVNGLSSGIANGFSSGYGNSTHNLDSYTNSNASLGYPDRISTSQQHPYSNQILNNTRPRTDSGAGSLNSTITIPNSSYHSLHHARSTLSFESRISHNSQISYDPSIITNNTNVNNTLLNIHFVPLSRYYSRSSNNSIHPTSSNVTSTITIPSRNSTLISDKDSIFSTATEPGGDFDENSHLYDPVHYLPSEIIIEIFRYLNVEDLVNCLLVSQDWKEMAGLDDIWRYKYHKSGWESLKLSPNLNWKSLYKTRYLLEERWRNATVTPNALTGHTDGVYCVHMDNERIITGSRDKTIKVWDLNSGKLLLTLGNSSGISHTGSVLCVASDGELMVSGSSDSSCIIWQLPKYKPIKKVYRHSNGVLDVCLNKDYIISCSKDTTISVWDRKDYNLKYRLHGHRGPVNALHLKDNYIFSASGDGLVKMWNISNGTLVREFKSDKGLACVQVSEDGKKVISGGSDNIIRIWDVETGRCINKLIGHKGLVRSLFIFGDKIISGSYDQTINVWNIKTGELITNLNGWHGSWIFSIKADCKRIVSTSFGTKPVILDFSNGLDDDYIKCIKK